MRGRDGAGLVEGGGEEGVVGEAVDRSGQAAGGLEEGLEGGCLEQRELAAGQGEAVGFDPLGVDQQVVPMCLEIAERKLAVKAVRGEGPAVHRRPAGVGGEGQLPEQVLRPPGARAR